MPGEHENGKETRQKKGLIDDVWRRHAEQLITWFRKNMKVSDEIGLDT